MPSLLEALVGFANAIRSLGVLASGALSIFLGQLPGLDRFPHAHYTIQWFVFIGLLVLDLEVVYGAANLSLDANDPDLIDNRNNV
jgi:hypothetical protein